MSIRPSGTLGALGFEFWVLRFELERSRLRLPGIASNAPRDDDPER
jgi:hypothetical protein